MILVVAVVGGFLHSRGRSGGRGGGVFVAIGLLGSLDGDGCWRTKTDSLGEEDVGIAL